MQETNLCKGSNHTCHTCIDKLRTIFPDTVIDGKVDFDKLRTILGEDDKVKDERYNFSWNGKSAAFKLAKTPAVGVLHPCKEESKNWDTTKNIYIEGDNLEVLKLLQKSYQNKIKMIYIDPPYNTGNDFVYKDKFRDKLGNYKKNMGQIDETGLSAYELEGRYHTNWLNMIYPRLVLSHNLLSDDGIIFISIDDYEQEKLKIICNEIFGESNFVGTIIRKVMEGGKSDSNGIAIEHEYCHVYAKNDISGINKKLAGHQKHYNKKDKYFNERGYYYLKPLENGGLGYIASMDYPIIGPDKINIYPGGKQGDNGYRWVWSKEKLKKAISIDMIEFIPSQKDKSKYKVYYKIYEKVDTSGRKTIKELPFPSIYLDGYTNRQAINELKTLFDGKRIFDYPKPVSFIKELCKMATDKNSIILDFFSGSATTAQACMQLNSEDNGSRTFIAVQIPDITDKKTEAYKSGYKNICEIGKERIRRAGDKILKQVQDENSSLKTDEEFKKNPDVGFRVFKLDTKNV